MPGWQNVLAPFKITPNKKRYFSSIIRIQQNRQEWVLQGPGLGLNHREGLEHAPFVVLVYFFSSLEHAKNLLIMGPNNTKNSSLKCDFIIFNYE
jgi:hypothetical protein